MNRLLLFIFLLCCIAAVAPRALRTARCVDFNRPFDVTSRCITNLDRGTGLNP